MDRLSELSSDKVTLLAIHFASSSNVSGLRKTCALRPDVLRPQTVLRIILTYLPETLDAQSYLDLLHDAAARLRGSDIEQPIESDESYDISPVLSLEDKRAARLVKRSTLLPISPTPIQGVPPQDVEDRRHDSEKDLEREDLQIAKANHIFACFLVHRARRIDAQTGLLQRVPPLLLPFLDSAYWLRVWYVSQVVPLLRWNSSLPEEDDIVQLEVFEHMDRFSTLGSFLAAAAPHKTSLLLRELVSPWLRGYQERSEAAEKFTTWQPVFEWLFFTASTNFSLAADAVMNWDGPEDEDLSGVDLEHVSEDILHKQQLGYAQTGLAIIYATADSSPETLKACRELLMRIGNLLDIGHNLNDLQTVPELPNFDHISASDLAPTDMLRPGNPLTTPSEPLLLFMISILQSTSLLAKYRLDITYSSALQLYLFDSEDDQRLVLQRITSSLSAQQAKAAEWQNARNEILWLWGWGRSTETETGTGLLRRLRLEDLETELLRAMLLASRFDVAKAIYVDDPSHGIPLDTIEQIVLDVAMAFYDNASNGNKSRGGMKKAVDTIAIIYPSVSKSDKLAKATHLIAATHALSFYSLTLQHGVPFKPVNIRVHNDPISLITKLLEQNAKSFTKLDDLISIALLLVDADLSNPEKNTPPAKLVGLKPDTERRVMAMAIEAALAEDDFGTAYSYIVNRLLPSSLDTSQKYDDVLWRAAFQAGKFRPIPAPSHGISTFAANLSNVSSTNSLQLLEMRLELLSRALLLAPPTALPEILAKWRQAEEELNSLIVSEADVDETPPPWPSDSGEVDIPGAFEPDDRERDRNMETKLKQARLNARRPTDEDDDAGPMGLFDVASNAARAFRRTAFPLSAGRGSAAPATASKSASKPAHPPPAAAHEDDGSSAWDDGWGENEDEDEEEQTKEERVRTRDRVGNLVTGGLVSGIGWVIGAQPSRAPDRTD